MMTYTKKPIDFTEQITLLKNRGLVIENEEYAISKLKNISYYRLANYWRPMESDKYTHQFKPNCKFGDIIGLYDFDIVLRSLIFTAIQHIEIAFRSHIIHSFSLSYGSFWFMDKKLFRNPTIFDRCLTNLSDEIHRTKEEFIIDHFAKYDTPPYPPVWKSLEVVSFGTLSKIYCNFTDNAVKKKVAHDLCLPQHIFLESWMTAFAVLRNCCAHHARTWNRIFTIKPQIPTKLPEAWITDRSISPSKLYPQLCCLQYLLNTIGVGESFKTRLKELFVLYPNVDSAAMGFPASWKNEPLWE
ncbi:MAG: Abi family protein [Bacteroidaceae bacterium]|nr:Abi family protein [Bacteroidaceae bacterium]